MIRHPRSRALVRLACAAVAATAPVAAQTGARFEISFPASVHGQPITGRVFVFVAQDSEPEPRFQGGSLGANGPFFGLDVDHLAPGASARIDAATPGFPIASLRDIPEGDYYVQAVLNVYTQMHRADGHTIWVHADQWEGQQFAESPGNLVSKVRRVHIAPRASRAIRITLSDVVPPVEIPADTKWIKHVKIQSALLSKFWGHPIYLGAVVLLPRGYDEHPDVHYPVDYEQDHFSLAPPYHFQEERVDPVDSNVVGHRAWVVNLRRREGYRLYQDWTSDSFPPDADGDVPAPHAVLRRFVRSEFGQRRPIRRCDHDGAHPVHRIALPHHQRALGARIVRRLHGRMGIVRVADLPSRVFRRCVDLLSQTRSTSANGVSWTSTTTTTRSIRPAPAG